MDLFDGLTVLNTLVLVVYLVAGGWVSLRKYFVKREEDKAAEAKAKADAESARIEAAVQARLAVAQATAAVTPAAEA